jgi:hypothetical protein
MRFNCFVALLFLCLALSPFRLDADGLGPVRVTGDVSAGYRFQAAVGDFPTAFGNDLSQGLHLDVSFSSSDLLSAHLSADAREVLGPTQYSTTFSPLLGLSNAWATPVSGDLYEAYLDLKRSLPWLPLVRFGRQAAARDEPFFFDGVTVQLDLGSLFALTTYGGVAVHFYELDYAWGSDLLAGAGLDFYPWPATRLSVDYAYVQDTRTLFLGANQYNHLLSFRAWQRLFDVLRLSAAFRMINFAPTEVRLNASATFPDLGLDIYGTYFVQFVPLLQLSNELSGYYDVLGQALPFQSVQLKARKLLGDHFGVSASGFLRGLLGGDQAATPFNRQYGKLSLGVEVIDLPVPGLDLEVPAEMWISGANQYYSTGFSLTWRPIKERSLAFEAGTYFSLYKYDYGTPYLATFLGEREDVQTYYLEARVPLGQHFVLEGRYELEHGSEFLLGSQTFHTFRLGVRSAF